MPRFDFIYTNFSAGEFSPLLSGRIDLDKYRSGCEILENFIPRPHGPAVGRGGMRYIWETKDSTKKSRLVPFDAGSGAGQFHIEFGDQYLRFYTEDGILIDTSPDPDVIYEIATTYLEDELFDIYYFQDANVLYLFHPDHEPAKLERVSEYNWTLTNLVFSNAPTEWGANNWPGCGAFYEERLYYGGCPSNPEYIWGSKVGSYFDLDSGSIADDYGFAYRLYTDKINQAYWMSPGEILAIGTSGGEYKMMSTSLNEAITPTNVKFVRQTNYGVARVMPTRIGGRVLFVQKGRLKIRNFEYSLSSDGYVAKDVSILSEHITFPGIVESDYTNEPDSISYYIRDDGELVGMAYEPEIETASWFRIVTDGEIESVSVTDGWDDNRYDDVMLIVKRNIDGGVVRYVEKLERPLSREQAIEDAFFVDSGLTYEGVPANQISGLDHLEGETVRVLVDGATHPDRTVSGGEITLQREGSKVHVGLGYDPTLKTMRIEGGNPIGTSQGKTKRIAKTQVRVDRTVGITVNGERYFMGPPVMDEPVQLYSGDIEVDLDDGHDTAGQIEIIQNQPLPITVVAIMPEARTQ